MRPFDPRILRLVPATRRPVAALAGIGIAWVTESRVADHVAAGRLVRVLPEWSQDFGALCLYYPANRHPPAALRLFVEAVRTWLAAGREAPPA